MSVCRPFSVQKLVPCRSALRGTLHPDFRVHNKQSLTMVLFLAPQVLFWARTDFQSIKLYNAIFQILFKMAICPVDTDLDRPYTDLYGPLRTLCGHLRTRYGPIPTRYGPDTNRVRTFVDPIPSAYGPIRNLYGTHTDL